MPGEMIEAAEQRQRSTEQPRQHLMLRRVGVAAGVAVAAVILWGGYAGHWSWTGLNGRNATLWDWLHLLLLPLAVAILPLWLSRRTRLPKRHKLLGFTCLIAFGVLVLVGYAMPWNWTGFVGNRLWDWLELLVLPLAVALTPVIAELRGNWTRLHTLIAVTLVGAFVVVVIGGYVGSWKWTGFRGNTLWNWLELWLLPLLIPVLVIPALRPRAMSGVIVLDEDEQAKPEGEQEPAEAAQSVPASESARTEGDPPTR